MAVSPSPSPNPNPGAIDVIYEQLNSVLGGTDPNQFLSLTIPGTILNQSDYAYDTTTDKPATVTQAESLLVDQMFDLAQVSGSSNGERVSDQYLQALSVLVPTFDPAMPLVKQKIRDYLRSPAPSDASIRGVPFKGNLGEYYFALVEVWLAVKSAWEKEVIPARSSMTKEDFLEWYEERAETRLAEIDAAYGRLLSVFSPSDMDALLGALASGPDGAIEEAVTEVLDLRLPSPDGGYIYPVELIPSDWFLDIASDEDPTNLLQDPQFIALTITARRQAISASIGQIQTLLSQVPSGSDLAAAAAAVATAQTNYTNAQNALLQTYSANTVTAVEMYMAAETGGLDTLNGDVAAVSKAANNPTPDTVASTITGTALSNDDLNKLLADQNTLITAQSNLLSSAQGLASAGMNLASAQSQTFGALPVMLARLQSQLSDVTAMEAQIGSAISAAAQRSLNPPPAVVDQRVVNLATSVGQAIQTATDPVSVLTAVWKAIDADPTLGPQLYPIYGAANTAWATAVVPAITDGVTKLSTFADDLASAATAASTATKPPATLDSVLAAVMALLPEAGTPEQAALQYIGADAKAAANISDIVTAVQSDVTKLKTSLGLVAAAAQAAPTASATTDWPTAGAPAAGSFDAATNAALTTCTTQKVNTTVNNYFGLAAVGSTPASGVGGLAATSSAAFSMTQQAAQAAAAGFSTVPAPSAKPALSSDRWMELQFSFSSDQMTSSSQQASLSTQTSWSVDLFLGSASGSSQTSSASNAQSMLSADTAVQIGMKATKVVINRPWFNPGLFKLTGGMNRLSLAQISQGSTYPLDKTNVKTLKSYNDALLPCFPVAFLIVKDVTIQFQAELSALDAVHTVLDSRSAVGGGFLCFSASSSSAAHQDSNAVSSHTQDTVVSINMPGPQILGWFLEFTPSDGSQVMSPTAPTSGNDLNILQFIDALEAIAEQEAENEQNQPPPQPPQVPPGF